MRSRFLRIVCGFALLSCFIAGCGGDGFDRVSVSGTVTLDGDASQSGSILASPSEEGINLPNVGATLVDGKFSFPAEDGPCAGSYMFEISLAAPADPSVAGEAAETDQENETGPETMYQTTVDIPEGGTDSLAIELTSADLVTEEEF